MTTAAPHHEQSNTTEATLFVAFELREKTWKLGFPTGQGQKPRARTVTARHQTRVLDEIAQAKRRVGLPDTAPVVSCDEAGREGFWRPGSKPRHKTSVEAAPRGREQRGVVIGDGIFRLARVHESSGSRGLSGLHTDAVSKR
jgi:hypothetical protein